jgi:hypothetical protein
MKPLLLFPIFCFALSSSCLGQTAAVAPIQLKCHKMDAPGSVLGPDETLMHGMACRQVKQAPPVQPAQVVAPATKPLSTLPTSLKIVPNSRVFIAPMDGFESYLLAAFGKKNVQLIPVADQNLADYVISGTSLDKKAGWAKIIFMGNVHSDNAASITMTDRRTSAIVYAYAVDKKSTLHGQQTTAEACAKHLQAHIEGRQ